MDLTAQPLPHLTFRHWAGLSPYTSAFALAQTCVFVKQLLEIRLLQPLLLEAGHLPKVRPANLPSSLTIVLSLVLVYSTFPPVSVLVRIENVRFRGFSWKYKSSRLIPTSRDFPIQLV